MAATFTYSGGYHVSRISWELELAMRAQHVTFQHIEQRFPRLSWLRPNFRLATILIHHLRPPFQPPGPTLLTERARRQHTIRIRQLWLPKQEITHPGRHNRQ